MIIAFSAIILLTGVDQLIKYWAVESLKGTPSREFIKIGNLKILNLTYLENDGAVFGSFSGMRWILVGVTAALMIFCIYYMIKHRNNKFMVICLSLVVSGGLGNIIDRLFRGGLVVDYLDVQLFNFAIFNFADCCVVIGVILLLVYVLFFEKEHGEKVKKGSTDG
ncbi:signal peptidase II [Porcipelethomonas sp.]|uniref:signal peptidase II n=1 Tax=Porcipelethomonas sp. TaxID=2981675 RepID=UPI003EF81B69